MKTELASTTADQVALSRAIESMKPPGERLCFDPLARDMIAAKYRALTVHRLVRAFTVRMIERLFPGHHGYVVARTRYLDDRVEEALADGVEQVVILGAGFDSRPYRIPGLARVAVFEVDHPATQAAKRAKICRLLGAEPAHVTYVAIDFCAGSLSAGLSAAGYADTARTLFLWEGTTPYLTAEAVDEVLRLVASNTGRDTRIAFDYILDSVVSFTCDLPGAVNEARKMARTDEPFRFGIAEAEVTRFLEQRGFRKSALARSEQLAQLYRDRGLDAPPIKPWWRILLASVDR